MDCRQKNRHPLVRRQAVTTAPIRVSKQELKLADQSWREQLRANDPVSVFMIGTWTPARISRREGRYVYVQPSFTNYVKKIHIHSGELCYTQHDNPLWQEDETRDVMFEGLQRGEGLMLGSMGRHYTAGTKAITHVTFNLNELELETFRFRYQHLTADEIAYDLRENCTYRQHPVLHDMVSWTFAKCDFPCGLRTHCKSLSMLRSQTTTRGAWQSCWQPWAASNFIRQTSGLCKIACQNLFLTCHSGSKATSSLSDCIGTSAGTTTVFVIKNCTQQ